MYLKYLAYVPDSFSPAIASSDKDMLNKILKAHAISFMKDQIIYIRNWKKEESIESHIKVLFASDPDDYIQIVNKLEETIFQQELIIHLCLSELNGKQSFEELVNEELKCPIKHSNRCQYMKQICDILYGDFTTLLGFFNIHTGSARIFLRDVEGIKADPKNWALVVFDERS